MKTTFLIIITIIAFNLSYHSLNAQDDVSNKELYTNGYDFEWGSNSWTIKGDFNGDGKEEILTEHRELTSNYEENTLPLNLEKITADSLWLMMNEGSHSLSISLICSNTSIDTIFTGGRATGLIWFKNVGDIDGNGTDEISLVVDWADNSSSNSCNIYSYHNNKWVNVHNINMMDWLMSWKKDETPFNGFVSKDEDGVFYKHEYDYIDSEVIKIELKIDVNKKRKSIWDRDEIKRDDDD